MPWKAQSQRQRAAPSVTLASRRARQKDYAALCLQDKGGNCQALAEKKTMNAQIGGEHTNKPPNSIGTTANLLENESSPFQVRSSNINKGVPGAVTGKTASIISEGGL